MLPDVSMVFLCRYDAMVRSISDSQSIDVAPSVADCSSVEDMSHTKQCIVHTDLSADVTSVCGILLPRMHGTAAKVEK